MPAGPDLAARTLADPGSVFRVYSPDELDADGYPFAWRRIADARSGIKDIVRLRARDRCVRCGHPYRKGENGNGEWSPCDAGCRHDGPIRWPDGVGGWHHDSEWILPKPQFRAPTAIEAQWRILTVHHLNGDKADCRWWNLAALCQRCHLTIQGKVKMDRPYDRQHSEWFIPYVCGFYAAKYLGVELTREQALERREELLMLEFAQARLPGLEPA